MTSPVAAPANPLALLRSRGYLVLLVVAAILGIPIAAAAYGYLALIKYLRQEIFTRLPHGLGYATAPAWWPLPALVVGGFLVALTIKYLPGRGGPSPAGGFRVHAPPTPIQLPGAILAALATLAFGAVVGPELPLIALGGGLAVLAVRLAKRDAPSQAVAAIGAAGSFAAISTLLGSPLTGAFLLMEASGLGGAMLGLVLVPGLLAAGIGALIFIGLDSLTGLGVFSLAAAGLPHVTRPTLAEFAWAIVIGVIAAPLGAGVRWLARYLESYATRRTLLVPPLAGLAVAGLAIAYAAGSGKSSTQVLFDGQAALPALLRHGASYTVGALLLLFVCKGLAYAISLSSFRGGPVFPSMFVGAAGGIAMSHLPGLPPIVGAALGMGAMCAVMLTLPLTSVLLATLILASDGLVLMPLVIVAVVVAHVAAAWIAPPPPDHSGLGTPRSGAAQPSRA